MWLLESGDCNKGRCLEYPCNTWRFVINEFVFVVSFDSCIPDLSSTKPHFTNLWLIFYPYLCLIPVNSSSSLNPFSFNFCKIYSHNDTIPSNIFKHSTNYLLKHLKQISNPQYTLFQFIYAQFLNHFLRCMHVTIHPNLLINAH